MVDELAVARGEISFALSLARSVSRSLSAKLRLPEWEIFGVRPHSLTKMVSRRSNRGLLGLSQALRYWRELEVVP